MTELHECDNFVQGATERFKQFALAHKDQVRFKLWKKYFWIRHEDGRELLQGNYEKNWLRPFMHDLRPNELDGLNGLNGVERYNSHTCGNANGWRLRVERQDDVTKVLAVLLSRIGG